MSRHIIDHRAAPDTGRAKNFWALERRGSGEEAHPAVRALHERPAERDGGRKLSQFLRIERGQTA